jgi:hypothetical protein
MAALFVDRGCLMKNVVLLALFLASPAVMRGGAAQQQPASAVLVALTFNGERAGEAHGR